LSGFNLTDRKPVSAWLRFRQFGGKIIKKRSTGRLVDFDDKTLTPATGHH